MVLFLKLEIFLVRSVLKVLSAQWAGLWTYRVLSNISTA